MLHQLLYTIYMITPASFSTIFFELSFKFLVFWFTPRSQLFSRKVRIIDFDELNLNLHLILYSQVRSNILSSQDFILDNIVKSSANIGDPKYTPLMKTPTYALLSSPMRSFINTKRSHGERTPPCLVPCLTSYIRDDLPSSTTKSFMVIYQLRISCHVLPVMPIL